MAHPIEHYERNRAVYSEIEQNLLSVNQKFMEADRTTQIILLQKASNFAIISIQAPLKYHEEAYTSLQFAETGDDVVSSLESVNYNRQKINWMHNNVETSDWDGVVDLLENGKIDRAHRYLLDECKGLGIRKSAFTLAMLGFAEKMCVDTNVAQACGYRPYTENELDTYNGVVVDKYEKECKELRECYPDLQKKVSNFMWQWIVFDSQRESITTHDPWFLSIEGRITEPVTTTV